MGHENHAPQTGVSPQGWKETHTSPYKPVHVGKDRHTHIHTHIYTYLLYIYLLYIYIYIYIFIYIYQMEYKFIYHKYEFIVDLYWIIKNMWIMHCKYTSKFLVFEVICSIFQ